MFRIICISYNFFEKQGIKLIVNAKNLLEVILFTINKSLNHAKILFKDSLKNYQKT